MFKKSIAKIMAVALAGVMVFSLAGCGSKGEVLKKVKENKKIVLGTSADYAPYEFHTIVDGKDTIVGFDIQIAKEIAKDLGVELEVQDMGFDGLLQALNADKIDMVLSGMDPDKEGRRDAVDFSKIYYKAEQGIMIRTEDKDKIKTIDDLKGKSVGVQMTTTQEEIAKEQMKDSKIVSLGKIPDLVLELKNKKVDAIVVELPVANGYVKNNTDLIISDAKVKFEGGGSAVAVKKGNADLVAEIDKTLDRIMKDGTLDKYIQEANEQNVVEAK